MNPLVKKIIQYLIMIGLGVFLMWIVLKDLNFNMIVNGFKKANYFWITLALFVSLVAHYSRAVRWKLLMEPLGYSPSNFRTFLAVMTGYFANNIVPRAGEVSRCYVLKRTDNIPFNIAFGSVVAERVMDIICLLTITGLAFVLEFNHINGFVYSFFGDKLSNLGEAVQRFYLFIIIAVILVVLFTFYLYTIRERLLRFSFIQKIYNFFLGLWDGLTSVWKLKRKWEFIFHTILIWFCYILMTYLIFKALSFTYHLDLGAGLVIMVVGGFGMSAPVSGGLGAYHILVANALTVYGLDYTTEGTIFALVSHSSQFISLIVFGGICALLSFSLKPKATVEDELAIQNS
jgi:uncharacterized protein (TIRG00374 family)